MLLTIVLCPAIATPCRATALSRSEEPGMRRKPGRAAVIVVPPLRRPGALLGRAVAGRWRTVCTAFVAFCSTDVIDNSTVPSHRHTLSRHRALAFRRAGYEAKARPRSRHCRSSFAATGRAFGPRGCRPVANRLYGFCGFLLHRCY